VRSELRIPQSDNYKNETHRAKLRILEFWKVYAEAIGIIVVVGYTTVAGFQLGAMRGQLTEMRETRKQTKIDNASAIAAQQTIAQDSLSKSQEIFTKSAANSEKSFRDDQRAWLVAVGFGAPNPPFAEDKQPIFSVEITNSGKTPAIKVEPKISAWPYPKGQTFVPVYLDDPSKPIQSVGIISPGLHPTLKTLPPIAPLTKTIIDQVKHGSFIYYVYGVITYDDVSRRPHQTTFCFYLSTDLTSSNSCDTYNDAD